MGVVASDARLALLATEFWKWTWVRGGLERLGTFECAAVHNGVKRTHLWALTCWCCH